MASTTQGVPLGILEQQIWTRPVKAAKKKKKSKIVIFSSRNATNDFMPTNVSASMIKVFRGSGSLRCYHRHF